MSEQYRFVHEIVGTFVLLCLGLLIASIVFAGRIQGWFVEELEYSLMVPPGAHAGLKEGTEILLGGSAIGRVIAIDIAGDDRTVADVKIRGEYADFIRESTVAVIRRKFGIVGDAYIELTGGRRGPLLPEGKRIPASIDEDLNALVMETVKEVRDAFQMTLFNVNRFLAAYSDLAEALHDPVLEIRDLVHTLNQIAGGLEAGDGTAGALLKDEAIAREAEGVLADLRSSLQDVEAILADLKEASADIPAITAEAPNVLRQIVGTLAELEALIEGVQNHWLIRRYVEEDGDKGRLVGIDPVTIRAPEAAP